MSTFRQREPLEVLLDYQDELEHEILTAEQRAERYASDYRHATRVRAWIEEAKQLRAVRRKTFRAIRLLEGNPETAAEAVEP